MNFEDFLNSSDPVIAEAAQQLKTFTDQYKAGQMTQAEYQDVCKDVLNEQKIGQITSDMERQNKIYEAYQQLSQIVSVIGQIAPLL